MILRPILSPAADEVPDPPSQDARAFIATWDGWDHPNSYQAPVSTRDSLNQYFVVRAGSTLKVMKKAHGVAAWTLAATITGVDTSGQGDMASLAVDGDEVLHLVYLANNATANLANLVHRSCANEGVTWSAATLIKDGVTWLSASNSGPFLHVAADNTLHVAFSDDTDSGDEARPYYAYFDGDTWENYLVADVANTLLRPSVTTIDTGRAFVAFTGVSNALQVAYTDNLGVSFTLNSPTDPGDTFNGKITSRGNTVYLTGQETTGVRRILLGQSDGVTLSWTWDDVHSGTGADAGFFTDNGGGRNVVWRRYPDAGHVVFHSRKTSGAWVETQVTVDGVDHILNSVNQQPYHRFGGTVNYPMLILPETVSKNIYSQYLSTLTLG